MEGIRHIVLKQNTGIFAAIIYAPAVCKCISWCNYFHKIWKRPKTKYGNKFLKLPSLAFDCHIPALRGDYIFKWSFLFPRKLFHQNFGQLDAVHCGGYLTWRVNPQSYQQVMARKTIITQLRNWASNYISSEHFHACNTFSRSQRGEHFSENLGFSFTYKEKISKDFSPVLRFRSKRKSQVKS